MLKIKHQSTTARAGLQKFITPFVSAVAAFLLISPAAHALTSGVAQLVHDETRANAAAKRSEAPIEMEHFEIPYRLVEKDVSERTPKDVLAALLFEKNGETYIRWVINPEDTEWHLKLEEWLAKQGADTTKYKYFTAYQTASRSYIVEDPQNHAQFSIKVSTNRTGGQWKSKKQEWVDVKQIRSMTDFIEERNRANPAPDIVIMDEPAGWGVAELDQGMIVRLLADLPKGDVRYVPGFSIVENLAGARLAKKNKSADPVHYWDVHYNQALGRGLAELFGLVGISYDSPHSQNFLVEFDKTNKPTGRIVLRDFGDVYLAKEFFKAAGKMDIYNNWERENKLKGTISANVGILHGNKWPDWMHENNYRTWGRNFYKAYDQQLNKELGLNGEPLKQDINGRQGAYFVRAYGLETGQAKPFFTALKKGPKAVQTFRCEAIF